MAALTTGERVARLMEMMIESRAAGPRNSMPEEELYEAIGHGFAILLDFLGNVNRIADGVEAIAHSTVPRPN